MKKAVIYFIAFVVMNLAVSFGVDGIYTLIYGKGHEADTTQLLIMSGTASALTVILFTALGWCPVSRDYIRSRPWATFFWTTLLALGTILPLSWLEGFIPDSLTEDFAGEIITKMLGTTEGYFVICMLAPLAEEIVFRGAIIRRLVEWGRAIREKRLDTMGKKGGTALTDRKVEWVAIIISSLLFALAHLNPAQVPHAIIVGVLLGWLFVKTGSIVPGFLLHWINNSMAYVMLKMFPYMSMDSKLIAYFHGNSTAMYQAIFSSLLIALPALYQLIIMKRRAW